MEILVKAIAGSHLFGTNTPASDTDFKGVYLPSKEELLLGTAKPSVSIKTNESGLKNTKDDVDVEFYSLQKFMQMLHEGQTVALELLWTPEDKIITKSPFWDELRSHRAELLHKKVTAFVHYCKTQADKYGVKGSRMGAAKKVLTFLGKLPGYDRMSTHWDSFVTEFSNVEHIEFGSQDLTVDVVRHMEVCNRKFQEHAKVEYVLNSLSKLYESYGARAKAAENSEGIDWKALSHAYRVCCQAIEILSEETLTLPLRDKDRLYIMQVKRGEIPFKDFQPKLEKKLEQVLAWQNLSKLPEDFDYNKWCKDFVMKVYKEQVNKE
jgi:predicted nucleotidyltransferase